MVRAIEKLDVPGGNEKISYANEDLDAITILNPEHPSRLDETFYEFPIMLPVWISSR